MPSKLTSPGKDKRKQGKPKAHAVFHRDKHGEKRHVVEQNKSNLQWQKQCGNERKQK